PVRRPAVGAGPVLRRHARVGDELTAAAVQLPGHPAGDEPLPQLGPRGPRRRRPAARTRRAHARARARDAGDDSTGRVPRRDPRDADRILGARHRCARADPRLRLPAHQPLRHRRDLRHRSARGRRRLAHRGAAGSMTDGGMDATIALDAPRAEQPRAAQPNGWWGMVLLIATEATLFGCLFGSYFY